MSKDLRVNKAKETLDIIENGIYKVESEKIDIKKDIENSIDHSRLYKEDGFKEVMADADKKISKLKNDTKIRVANIPVLGGATEMVLSGEKVGCLNFASAKNPGGGFLNGAMAQEESLALSSCLYATQMKNFGFYQHHRGLQTYLYSDCMIYSPDVVVFRDDAHELLKKPYNLSIITSPAVNIGAMKTNLPSELKDAEAVMQQRLDKVLALFVHHGIKYLLLGAWGCGVFQNRPEDVAALFASYLSPGKKYGSCFEEVLFAVYDRSKNGENIRAFEEQFG